MIKTCIQMSTGEEIYIYDNVFSPADAFGIQHYVENSNYGLGSVSYPSVNSKQGTFLKSAYNKDDFEKLEIFTYNFKSIIDNHMQGLELSMFWANATTHLPDSRFHSDGRTKGRKTLLYYVNNKWDSDWGGETLFKNSQDVLEKAIEFKPNRAVVFDSFLPHKSAPLNITADMYRFVLVLQFKHPET
jgi:Rps23 Pro-64 3,4-dihydroxylase Tpa1-like proline 4-hydroxylase